MAGPATQSGPIALTPNGEVLLKVNPSNDTLSLLDPITLDLVASVDVGETPSHVVTANGNAYVSTSNGISVVNLSVRAVTRTLPYSGCALVISPNGTRLFIDNDYDEKVIILDAVTGVEISKEPFYRDHLRGDLAVSNDGDADDTDEHVYLRVTGSVMDDLRNPFQEGQDDQREGLVEEFSQQPLGHTGTFHFGPMVNTGFNANGKSAPANQATSSPAPAVASTNPPTANTPTGAFPSLPGGLAPHPSNGKIYIASTGASPNGPASPDTNHHGLISVLNALTGAEVVAPQTPSGTVQKAPLNMNEGVNLVAIPGTQLYYSNPVAIAWQPNGAAAWIVNQNTNRMVRMTVDANGIPTIGAPLTAGPGQIIFVDLPLAAPDGICINAASTRAFVSSSISRAVCSVDISVAQPVVIETTQTAPLPAAGSREALALRGETLFHSALSPMSAGWSSCSSCHPGGHSDNVTWMFPTGPRQTPSLCGVFDKNNSADQKILNWNAIFDEVEDCEIKVRTLQGGRGLIEDERLVFAAGGATAAGDSAGIEQFHHGTGAVTNTGAGGAMLPSISARRDHSAVTLPNGRVLYIGGRTGAGQGTLVTAPGQIIVEFDPVSNTVTSCESAGFTPRHSCSAGVVQLPAGPRVYVAGGYTDTSPTSIPVNTVEEYNPDTRTWRTVAPMPQAVAQAACCVAGGISTSEPLELMHVFSGNKSSEAAPLLLAGDTPAFRLQRFQADAAGPGTWTTFNPSRLARRLGGIAAVVKDSTTRIYLFGGIYADGNILTTVQQYSAQAVTNVIDTMTSMPVPVAGFGIGVSATNNKIYIAGGVDASGTPRSDIFEYDIHVNGPVAGSTGSPSGAWTLRGQLAAPRHRFPLAIGRGVRALLPHSNAGRSGDWDAIRAYIAGIPALPAPVPATDAAAVRGRALFTQTGLAVAGTSCATCHGGAKWTRSTVDYSCPPSPDFNTGMGDERVFGNTLGQTLTQPASTLLRNAGTYGYSVAGSVNEIRPGAVDVRTTSQSLNSYNVPSLLSVHATAPYFHSGLAPTLEVVLNGSLDGNGAATVRFHNVASAADRADLTAFLRSIDDETPPIPFSSGAPALIPAVSFDTLTNEIRFTVNGTPDQVYTIESSRNLRDWRTLRSFKPANGVFEVVDRPYFSNVYFRAVIR
jgi:hypothetical protein